MYFYFPVQKTNSNKSQKLRIRSDFLVSVTLSSFRHIRTYSVNRNKTYSIYEDFKKTYSIQWFSTFPARFRKNSTFDPTWLWFELTYDKRQKKYKHRIFQMHKITRKNCTYATNMPANQKETRTITLQTRGSIRLAETHGFNDTTNKEKPNEKNYFHDIFHVKFQYTRSRHFSNKKKKKKELRRRKIRLRSTENMYS